MKKIEKLLKKHQYIAFMDFEGTQFSHEMIAMGAIIAKVNKNGTVKAFKKPFKCYVKAKNKIGTYVTNLTGINDTVLKENGVCFRKAMELFKKYCGIHFSKNMSFVTFGNHDMRILSQSVMYNLDAPREICSIIMKNYIDFSTLISEFVRDDKYNPMSLVHYCELYGVKVEGNPHDPEFDAISLAYLYVEFLKRKSLTLDEYLKVLKRGNNLPVPVKNVIAKLAVGQNVSAEEFKDEARKYLE